MAAATGGATALSPLLGPLVLILLALLGARVSLSSDRVPSGARLLLRTGTHFLLIGFLLGPQGVGLLTDSATRDLSPLLAMGLGWVGLHFGMQLSVATLRSFPLRYYVAALGQGVLALVIFLVLGGLIARALPQPGAPTVWVLLAAAAAIASVTTPAGVALVTASFGVRGRVRDLLLFIASLDAVVGVVALQVLHASARPVEVGGSAAWMLGPPEPGVLGLALGLGAACGILFVWLTRVRPAPEELVLFLLGICAFASGAALQWGLSPLFVSMVIGAVAVNLHPDPQRLLAVLSRWEKVLYMTLLLLAGALLRVETWWIVPLALGYTLVRFVAKGTAGAVVAALVPMDFAVPRRFGLGLIPQGGIALAMAVSVTLVYPELRLGAVDAGNLLFAAVVLGVVLSELAGPLLTTHLLRRAGEMGDTQTG